MPEAVDAVGQLTRPKASSPPQAQRWRQVFPGRRQELSQLRRWLSSLLPECPARDDLISVASELGSNALQHTASGQPGGWFVAEVGVRQSMVVVAVADGGGPAEPQLIDDPDGEHGRGLLLVNRLSLRAGFAGDQRGRVVWAQIAWPDPGSATSGLSHDRRQVAAGDGERRPADSRACLAWHPAPLPDPPLPNGQSAWFRPWRYYRIPI